MIVIQGKSNSIVIGTEEFPLNSLCFQKNDSTGFVQIKTLQNIILFDLYFSDYANNSHVPYISLQSLLDDLSTLLLATGSEPPSGIAGGDLGGSYPNPTVVSVGGKSSSQIVSSVNSSHTQGTDQGLDNGGTNAVTAAQAKAAYTHSQVTSGNPHNVTKSEVGLGNVDNTSDVSKPVSTTQQSALDLKQNQNLSRISSSTYKTVQEFMNFALSAGSSSGGVITDAGGATFNVASGTGFIKAIDSNVSTISFFDWVASNGNAISSNTIKYVGVQYNAGTPNVIIKSSDTWDFDTEFPLGIVVNENGTLYIINIPFVTADNMTNLIERFDSLASISRDNRLGGLILSSTGTRNVAITSGSLMARMEEFAITAIDTSISGTFDAYYRNGSGDWTKQTSQTQYDNTKYDNGSGTLASLTILYYTSRWFYLMTDGTFAIVYGQNQFLSIPLVENDAPPSTIPNRISKLGMLIGRIIVQQGTNTPASTQTVFTTTFSSNQVQNHNDLANLQGGTIGEYYHITSNQNNGLVGVSAIGLSSTNKVIEEASIYALMATINYSNLLSYY